MPSYTITEEFVKHADEKFATGKYYSRSYADLEFIEFYFRDNHDAVLVDDRRIDFMIDGEGYETKHMIWKYDLKNHDWQKGCIKYYVFFAIRNPVKGRIFSAGDTVEFDIIATKTYDEVTELMNGQTIYRKDVEND